MVRELGGTPIEKTAADAIKDILENGVTPAERGAVAAMLANLQGTPHAGLAQRIFDGVAKGADASTLQKLRDRLVGPSPTSDAPSVTWREVVPNASQQRAWNGVVTQSQLDLSTKNGTVGRGFHDKQVYGGAVSLKVNPSLPKEAQIPPFWDAKTNKPVDLAGVIRMSNGQGCPFKDSAPDVRGLAVKLVDPQGKAWEILSTNHQTFAEDVPQFIGFTDAIKQSQLADNPLVGQAKMGAVLLEKVGPLQAARITAALAKDTVLQSVESMATQSFDGGVFKTPDGYLAKIVMTPVPGNVACMSKSDMAGDENGLTTDMYRHFQSGPVKYRMQLKIFTGNGDELKQNDKWEPAKLIDIGELSIPPPDKSVDAKIQAVVNGMRFNPGTGFDPAGQMTRARGAQPGSNVPEGSTAGIYQTSAYNRRALADDADVLALARSIGKGTVNAGALDATFAEVSRRTALLKQEVASGAVKERLEA
ncbi:MAG TPA: hypothetical protein VGO62_03765 [Myxococcota bacterium]